jgi:hypothetical protein
MLYQCFLATTSTNVSATTAAADLQGAFKFSQFVFQKHIIFELLLNISNYALCYQCFLAADPATSATTAADGQGAFKISTNLVCL